MRYYRTRSTDVIFTPAPPTPAPASDTKPASIKPLTPIAPTPPQTSPPPPVPSSTIPAPTVAPSKTPSLPPSKPPRSPSPHPMVTSDVLDDITFEDEDLCDVGADEGDPIVAEPPTKAPFANVSTFLHEEIRSGAGGQKKRDISRAR